MKKIGTLSLALLLAATLLSSCQKEEPIQWDPRWVDYFKLSEADQETFRGLLEDVNVTVETGDLTLTLGQTVSDAHHLYLLLDITLPEEVKLSDYPGLVGEEPTLSLTLGEQNLCRVQPDGQATEPACLESSYGIFSSSQSLEADLEDNTIHGWLWFSSPTFPFSQQDMTLSFRSIQIEGGAEPIPLTQGDYAITWFTGSHEGSVEKTILAEDGEEVGTLSLSPLGLSTALSKISSESSHYHLIPMTLYDTNGQALPTPSSSGGGWDSISCEYQWVFFSPLDPAAVGAVEIDGHRVEF